MDKYLDTADDGASKKEKRHPKHKKGKESLFSVPKQVS